MIGYKYNEPGRTSYNKHCPIYLWVSVFAS